MSRKTCALLESLESRRLMAQTPYGASPVALPGTVEAENYDKGGEGVAYHDTSSTNQGGQYRTNEGVDIESGGTGKVVGFVQAGEFLEYTVGVASGGTFQVDFKLATGGSGGTFHLSVDGNNKTGNLSLGNTGGWETFKTISKGGISLPGGTHVLRVMFDSSNVAGGDIGTFDSFKFTKTDGGGGGGTDFSPNPLKWKSVATNPKKREEAQSLVYNGKLFELGGYDDEFTASKRVDVYDPKSNKWSRLHDMPYEITHAAVAPDPDGHSFWFIGGMLGSFTHDPAKGPPATNIVYKYDAAKDTWSKQKSLPVEHGAGGAGIINNKLYFAGGSDKRRSKDLKDCYVLDLNNTSAGWKRIADLPNPRNHLGGIVAGGKLYIIGGQHLLEEKSVMQNEVDAYDPATNKWTKVASLPKSLSHYNASTVLYDRYIITVGGENPHNTPKAYVFAYDTMLNKWARLTDLPDARRAGVAGLVGNTLIQSTGFDDDHHETSTTWTADLSNVFI